MNPIHQFVSATVGFTLTLICFQGKVSNSSQPTVLSRLVAQQLAANNPVHPSFKSQLLDEQLALYLAYTATVGPPDILIVGSSRSLQGVDPTVLQAALVAQGYPQLRIYNFGINGATAQVIDFLLRRLLTPAQLPKLILWADGSRAFNSGRPDRTYEAISSSEGFVALMKGKRPKLPSVLSAVPECNRPNANATQSNISSWKQALKPSKSHRRLSLQCNEAAPSTAPLTQASEPPIVVPIAPPSPAASSPTKEEQAKVEPVKEAPAHTRKVPQPGIRIDANGFYAASAKFNSVLYYQKHPLVSGENDLDYRAFNLEGGQSTALSTLLTFLQKRQIPIVFVNLPLTKTYLDSTRLKYEKQFQTYLQRTATTTPLITIDLSQISSLQQNDYFTDPSHLNRYGAAAVSTQLATNAKIPWTQFRRVEEAGK